MPGWSSAWKAAIWRTWCIRWATAARSWSFSRRTGSPCPTRNSRTAWACVSHSSWATRRRKAFASLPTSLRGCWSCWPERGAVMTTDFELANNQLLIWAGEQLWPEQAIYNVAFAFHIAGTLDPQRFERALAAVLAETDALRMVVTCE